MTKEKSSGVTSSSNSPSKVPTPEGIEVHVFACGHGDTILLRLPANRWILIDCCLQEKDGTRARFLSYCSALGIRRLDFVFLTHPDSDHYLGMAEVLQHFASEGREVGYYCDAGTHAERVRALLRGRPGRRAYDRLQQAVRQLRHKGLLRKLRVDRETRSIRPKNGGDVARLVPIAPEAGQMDDVFDKDVAKIAVKPAAKSERNNTSIVLVLEFAGAKRRATGLLAADPDAETLKAALMFWIDRSGGKHPEVFDVVKVPHHGSWASHLPMICARPSGNALNVAVISAGDRTALPDRRVVEAFLREGWVVTCTEPRRSSKRRKSLIIEMLARPRKRLTPLPPSGRFDVVVQWNGNGGVSLFPMDAKVVWDELGNYEEAIST